MHSRQHLIQKLCKIGYLSIVTGLLYFSLSHRVYDDPFITYRYALNLKNGLGFVYNSGEQILSTTTPFLAMVLALGGRFGADIPKLANLIGAASVAIGGFSLWELSRTWKSPLVGWIAVLLYPTFPLLLGTLGSETPLFLAIILVAFLLYSRKQFGPVFFLLSLSILIRSDSVLVVFILGCHYLWVNRHHLKSIDFWRALPWGWITAAIGLFVTWHGFAWIYFGYPLPVTLAAKQAQGRMSISEGFAPGFLRVAGWYSRHWVYWIELALASLGLFYAIFRKHYWLLILSWTALYFLSYTFLGVTRYFWYYVPLVPGWIVLVGLGMSLIGDFPLSGNFIGFLSWKKLRRGLLISLMVILFLTQLLQVNKMRTTNDQRYPMYRAVGEWLKENTPPGSKVGALEVGIIGYFSQRPMVDFAGLIQPEVADRMKADTTYDDTAVWATLTYQPQYLVLIDGAHPKLESQIVEKNCHSVKGFSSLQYGFNDIQIYACQFD